MAKQGYQDRTAELFRGQLLQTLQAESRLNTGSAAAAATDPRSQAAMSLLSLAAPVRVVYGIITDTALTAYAYRVQLETAKQPVVAVCSEVSGTGVCGPRSLTTLTPGTVVICLWHEQLDTAQIIGVMPPPGTSGRKARHAVLSGSSRSRADEASHRPLRLGGGAGVASFTDGRLFDAAGLEAGWITETGARITIDPFMVVAGIDESCQLSFYLHDTLARLAAYQLQVWTACREHESGNDEDETSDWTGYAMYPWEQLGLAGRADPTRILTAQEWQNDTPWYSKMEPQDDRLLPFHRVRVWNGYLGQGGKKTVVAPPVEFPVDNNDTSSGALDISQGARTAHTSYAGGDGLVGATCPGLFDSFVTADGRFCLQSAKGVHIAKRPNIVAPTRLRRPDDPTGDTTTNYKASGVVGDGPAHQITGDLAFSEESEELVSNLSRAAGVLDLHAYLFNYAGVQPFTMHDKDYSLPEETEATWLGGKGLAVPRFLQLASQQYLTPEDYRTTLPIDHRYKEQEFYRLGGSLDLLDDGGLVLRDGYGSCLRMSGGNIELSAPGDICLRSGRNTVIWAGRDMACRAKDSFEVVATDGDGRIKSERNLQVLAGNSGQGGLLLESRGSGPSADADSDTPGDVVTTNGVLLRAKDSDVVSWSRGVYLRTLSNAGNGGVIVLDAGKGEGSLCTYAGSAQHYRQAGDFWHFSVTDTAVDGPSAGITPSAAMFPGLLHVENGILCDGNITAGGAVVSTQAFAAVNGPFVGTLEGDALASVRDALAASEALITDSLPSQTGTPFFQSLLRDYYYGAGGAGNDDTIAAAEFSFRSDEAYRSNGFVIYEDNWQQLLRASQQSGVRWHERPVTYQGQETYPYPGAAAFNSGQSYVQQSLTLFDGVAETSKNRGAATNLSSAYTDPKFGEQQHTSLQNYIVIAESYYGQSGPSSSFNA